MPQRKRSLSLCLVVLLAASESVAAACSFGRPPNAETTRRQVEEAVRDSDVLVEAVVESLSDGPNGTAVLRTHRLWKGPRSPVFYVSTPTSCNGWFSRGEVGRRVRVALWGGPEQYYMQLIRQPRRYQRLLDRALRRMTPYTASER